MFFRITQDLIFCVFIQITQDLIERLKSELSSNFENAVVALMLPPAEFDAVEGHRAIAGAGTDENTLIELLTTRTNSEIAALKAAYLTSVQTMFLISNKIMHTYKVCSIVPVNSG